MFTKYYKLILFFLGAFLATSLYAANYVEEPEQKEGENDMQATDMGPKPMIGYYNHTLRNRKKIIDNSVAPDDLETEKKDIKDNHIVDKLKHKQGTVFFIVITSSSKAKAFSKFFFINRAPGTEEDAIRRAEKSWGCHVISHANPNTSPHIIFQLLGWLAQEQKKHIPIFIHSNAAICCTCKPIVSSFFKINMPSNAKGCNGLSSIDLAHICPLAQQYINGALTLPLAKKLLLPTLSLTYQNKLAVLESKKLKLEKDLILSKQNLLIEKEGLQKESLCFKKVINKVLEITAKSTSYFGYTDTQKVIDIRNAIGQLPYSPLKGHTNHIYSVAVSTDNKFIVSSSRDKTIRIWHLKTGKEVPYSPLKSHTDSIYSVVITDDNRFIVSGSCDKTIRIWDLKTGAILNYSPLKGHTDYINSVAVTTDNKLIVSGSGDRTIRIWDFQTGAALHYSPLKGHTDYVSSVVITTDNKFIVSSGYDYTIRLWNLRTGKELSYSPLKGHTGIVYSVTVTKDNKFILSASNDYTIRIWNFKTGKELSYSPLKGHTNAVWRVAVTNDNKYIISGSDDCTIRIWDFKTGALLSFSPLKGHTDWVRSVAVTNDNKYIVSGSGDQTIRLWNLGLLTSLAYRKDECKLDNE